MAEQATAEKPAAPRFRRRRFSLLTRRILFLNLLAPVILVAALLYLDDYRRSLIAGEFADLTTQGQMIAAAVGAAGIEGVVDPDNPAASANPEEHLSKPLAQQILRRLVESTRARARLYSVDGELLADSRVLGAAGIAVETAPLPPLGPPPDVFTQVLISIYLGRTITRPIRRLAMAAERVRRGGQVVGAGIRPRGANPSGRPAIPDLSRRDDEIGDLSVALADMTDALWRRLDAIERFAADVSHEIKNPLTSLKSAVETAARLQDPEPQRKLLAIVLDDVSRLDRLIGDISDASRLDAELSREEAEPVDIGNLLATLVEVHTAGSPEGPRLMLEQAGTRRLVVPGLERRLGQVFRNLIVNAISFSPPRGTIRLVATGKGDMVEVTVEDEGPGISDDKLEQIFERFYSDRPEGEKFGTHSGLGLSISRQIVVAHGGTIRAENRRGTGGGVIGARFIVRLPVD